MAAAASFTDWLMVGTFPLAGGGGGGGTGVSSSPPPPHADSNTVIALTASSRFLVVIVVLLIGHGWQRGPRMQAATCASTSAQATGKPRAHGGYI
ncbi:hypothetical protein CCO03_05995 [Comamonas serinivorans]|uniref:Uncharacterized protein n=1 Tax=Comamonas serinivorans TaxID=1082851 RepID=A0A1Y0ELR4_9BURK|nr:hypothetical protein CCO03_05995 [Comamonas serinivorans]